MKTGGSGSAPSSPRAIPCRPTGPSAIFCAPSDGIPIARRTSTFWASSPASGPSSPKCSSTTTNVSQSDVVFGVTRHLIGDYRRHDASETPPAPDVEAPWYTLDYTFVMEPGEAKRPVPPIK